MTKLQESSYEDSWLEHSYVQWAISNSKKIGYWALIAVLLLIAAFRFFHSSTQKNELEFSTAENLALKLNSPANVLDSAKDLERILANHPELNAKYDGLLAQSLLTAGETDQAKPYAERTFSRVKSDLPKSFLDYSATTLLISQGKFQEALQDAQALQKEIENPTLYVFNTIRIALLERELQLTEQESKSWQEVQQLLAGTHKIKIDPNEMKKIVTHFDTQGVSISDFIKPALQKK